MSYKAYLPDSADLAAAAADLDAKLDAVVPSMRSEFAIPLTEHDAKYRAPGSPAVYLCGNSLGLMPSRTRTAIVGELDKWSHYGVEGHFRGERPWVSIEDTVVPLSEALVGAQPGEVAVMGSLTGNLHSLMAMMYTPQLPAHSQAQGQAAAGVPCVSSNGCFDARDSSSSSSSNNATAGAGATAGNGSGSNSDSATTAPRRLLSAGDMAGCRYRILTEAHAFPSDTYAVKSQLLLHGIDPAHGLLEVVPREGEETIRHEDILAAIAAAGPSLALVLLSGVQYYTGQLFDIAGVTAAGHAVGAVVGIDLAHAVGNVPLSLHEWGVDFAAWCSYKYLNSGPGGIAGLFLHSRYAQDSMEARPFQAGWWGADRASRFKMGPDFAGQAGAARLQLSNPPVLQTTALRCSLEVFASAGGVPALRTRSLALTSYLEALLTSDSELAPRVRVITPADPSQRGAQLSLVFSQPVKAVYAVLQREGVIVDIREPNAMRVAPAPLYNTACDVASFVATLKAALREVEAAQ